MTTEEIIETLEKSRKETAERIKVLQAFVDGTPFGIKDE